MAVMPRRAGLFGHNFDVFMAFNELVAAEIGVSGDFEDFALALTVVGLEIDDTGAVFVISDPLDQPLATIGAFHREPSIASPTLHMDSRPQFILVFLNFGLFLVGYAPFFHAFGLAADQFHTFETEVDIIHHHLAGGKIGDVLAMPTGRGVGFNNAALGITIEIDPARLDHQSRHSLPFDKGNVSNC